MLMREYVRWFDRIGECQTVEEVVELAEELRRDWEDDPQYYPLAEALFFRRTQVEPPPPRRLHIVR